MLRAKQPGRGRAGRQGAALLEFAVVAPLLLLVSMGIVEVTRATQVKTALGDAVRHGCRIGIQPPMENSDITAMVNSVLDKNGINKKTAVIAIQVKTGEKAAWKTADAGTAQRGAWIKVAVTIPLAEIGWVAPMIFSGKAKQTEALVMMRQ